VAEWVLDASAVLAFLRDEPGAALVEARLPRSIISSANLAEVASKMTDHGILALDVRAILGGLSFEIAPVDGALGLRAGLLRRETRARGLSLGDRICLALAEREGLPALTSDRAWAEALLGVEIVAIR
jgi:PIN domain nuclease of toxin-antitoxin system